ncbi:MAG: hypothetical protein QM647_08050 [Asticcacaulis sp.]|uniref:hypothetical protein n=1 Tax=Asticcacaulis sp. TaxID=1872648 RepID=UPI0039E53D06
MDKPSLYNSNSVRLGEGRKWSLHLVWLGLIASGITWLVLHYFVLVQGEFGPEHSPYEALSIKAHGAFAFLALWFGGMMWGTHMLKAWSQKRRRWTGTILLLVFAALIVSGYLLYYAGDESIREKASLIHWVIGLAVVLVYLLHRISKKS